MNVAPSTLSSPIRPTDAVVAPRAHQAEEFYTALIVVLGATSIYLGLIWDISWHMTIGRDTFWTPAHLAIYLGGTVGGILCGWLAIKTTYFSSHDIRASSVNLWGGRAPLGAWVVIWGAVAMITSAPFDDWWHNAYGLDVKIISPPHVVLFTGMFSIVSGALLLVLRGQSQWTGLKLAWSKGMFVYVGGVMLGMFAELFLSESVPNRQHGATFYFVSACVYPCILVGIARGSKLKWAATYAALAYLALAGAMVWVLPLFAASPKLGPIYNPVTHMVPHSFPLLLLLPALAIDAIKQRGGFGQRVSLDWLLVGVMALVFLALFLPAQWFFSEFLLTPAANNAFFAGGRYFSYSSRGINGHSMFWLPIDALTAGKFIYYSVAALLSARLGLWWGNWMVRVQR